MNVPLHLKMHFRVASRRPAVGGRLLAEAAEQMERSSIVFEVQTALGAHTLECKARGFPPCIAGL